MPTSIYNLRPNTPPSGSRDLEVGSNQHSHESGNKYEVQPSGLKGETDRFETPSIADKQVPTRTAAPAVIQGDPPDSNTSNPVPQYEGLISSILPIEHAHEIKLGQEDIQIPYIKVRICEKI